MKCPQCGRENPDGTMICEGCDFILDDSFLGDEGLSDDYADEDTPPGDVADEDLEDEYGDDPGDGYDEDFEEVPTDHFDDDDLRQTSTTTRGGSYSRPGAMKNRQQQIADDAEPDDLDDEIARQRSAMRAKRSKVAPIDVQRKLQRETQLRSQQAETRKGEGLAMEASQVGRDMENMANKAKDFVKGLGTQEQIALAGCVLAFLATVFPWVDIEQQGTRIGLEMGGVFVILLAGATGSLIYLSSQEAWLGKRKILLIGEAILAGIALIFVVSKLFTSMSYTVISPADGTAQTYSGSMQFGLVLAILGAGAMAGGIGMLVKAELVDKKQKIT